MIAVPVLEVGGTHATAALVDATTWRLRGEPCRVHVSADAPADRILDEIASAAEGLAVAPDATWAVAMPDPFDYPRGIGRFHGVAKFEALDGVDVRAGLLARLPGAHMAFCNDADAFALGEWAAGAAHGFARVMGLTLGTGVGSGWVADGRIVDPGVPPGGRAHLLQVDGAPLEDLVSRRAIRAAYASATGLDTDVREIAQAARAGDRIATGVLAAALRALGRALAAPVHDFRADVVVVGGSMSASWDLFEAWFRAGADGGAGDGAGDGALPPTRVAGDAEHAPLIGAAYAAAGG